MVGEDRLGWNAAVETRREVVEHMVVYSQLLGLDCTLVVPEGETALGRMHRESGEWPHVGKVRVPEKVY